MLTGEYAAIRSRGLSEETCRKFRYEVGDGIHIANYFDPAGRQVAQKIRGRDKQFSWAGKKKEAGLFGQQLWAVGGRKLVITEGEIDAMSVSQVQGNKWPVVSVQDGAGAAAKAVLDQLEFVESFDEVILMFDMDDVGREAAASCAELLSPGKAHIAELPRKDANEMLVDGMGTELRNAVWQAKLWRPDGFVSGEELWERMTSPEAEIENHPFPWMFLTGRIDGMRMGELLTLCAGPGTGKSTFGREIMYDLHQQGHTVGILALEEPVERTGWGLASIHTNQLLHRCRDNMTPETEEVAQELIKSNRLHLYDHFGSTGGDNLVAKIRVMARVLGCKFIFLDHLTIALSGFAADGDERQLIDATMTKLATLAQELKIHITLVCHLKRKDGKPFDQGGQVNMSDLRGSSQIEGLSHTIIALERNQQDEEHGDVVTVRVVKDRWTGETGIAGYLEYVKETGRLVDIDDPFGEDG
jgi:twinkle protein